MQESGWSPTYTLTEDFALGMLMKANKWHCCYVEEYLAIGEAPEQIRNCFQQRSRWCKVRFFCKRIPCPLACIFSNAAYPLVPKLCLFYSERHAKMGLIVIGNIIILQGVPIIAKFLFMSAFCK